MQNRAVLGSATKMRNGLRHFDENSANPQVEASPFATKFWNLHLLLVGSSLRGGFQFEMAEDGGSAIFDEKSLR